MAACLTLTDGSDTAAWMLMWKLVAMSHWTVKTSRPLICPPSPTILNIGHFLDEDVEWHRWDVHVWLQAYAHALQQTAQAAEGRCWMPNGRDFTPRVSLPVEAFAKALNMEILPASATSCWDRPPECVPHQRYEGPLAHVIS